eukprot:4729995-Alexandrium_andersonii.AAC.1
MSTEAALPKAASSGRHRGGRRPAGSGCSRSTSTQSGRQACAGQAGASGSGTTANWAFDLMYPRRGSARAPGGR